TVFGSQIAEQLARAHHDAVDTHFGHALTALERTDRGCTPSSMTAATSPQTSSSPPWAPCLSAPPHGADRSMSTPVCAAGSTRSPTPQEASPSTSTPAL